MFISLSSISVSGITHWSYQRGRRTFGSEAGAIEEKTPMNLHIRDTAPNFEAETTEGPVRCHDWIDYRGLTPDRRKRLIQHVIRDARAARPPAAPACARFRPLPAAERPSCAPLARRSPPRPANGGAPMPSNAPTSRRYASFMRSMTARSVTLG